MVPGHVMKTLIVDDEPIARRVLREELELIDGVEIVGEADSGEKALRQITEQKPDLVLLDLQMPGMGGLELQQRLTETGQRIPIVFLSARASEEEEKCALRAGAAGFLRKPANKEALLRAIHSVFEPPARNNNNPSKEL